LNENPNFEIASNTGGGLPPLSEIIIKTFDKGGAIFDFL
jgi:hypothetical protein